MNESVNVKILLLFGTPLFLLGILVLLMQPSLLRANEDLGLAITADLLLTVPLIWFLLIRKTKIPNTTVFPLMVLGLLLGSFLLPNESRTYLDLFKTWALPVIEVSILIFVVVKVRSAIKKCKELKGAAPDFFTALKSTCFQILPKKLVLPFATEVAVMYHGFIKWRTPKPGENEFTYHKKSGSATLFGAFILIIGIETIALHFLLSRWNIYAAWTLTGLSLYTAIQVLGFAKSLSQRPISINENSLVLKYGILNEAEIPLADIKGIELSRKSPGKGALTKTLSPLGGFESHNVIIYLNKECDLVGLYGMKKKFKVIALHVDAPDAFKKKIECIMQETSN